jgi:aconitate decarboxylase
MATLSLASWAVDLRREDLSAETVHAAVRSFYNWVGCTVHGSTQEAVHIVFEALSPLFGINTSCLLGHQGHLRADAEHAALLNGIASHVDDYDDTHPRSKIHPSGPVCSALLAYSEWKRPISGTDFIVAMVAGIEAECKLGLAVLPAHYEVGW